MVILQHLMMLWRVSNFTLNNTRTEMTELQQELLINKLKEIASEKTCYEMYGDFYDGIPQPTTRIFGDGIDYGKINLCRELLKLLEIEE